MKINGKDYRTIWFEDNLVKIIDQTKLPHQFIIKNLKTVNDAINAIKTMEVRGAPLIGATAAYGLVLSIIESNDLSFLKISSENLILSRPTAINLKWAVDRMMKKLSGVNNNDILNIALNEAKAIVEEDVNFCEKIGLNGLKIIKKIAEKKKNTINILTHCNAGWLATINWGTATSPIYHAHKKGIKIHVWVDETRPRNQGANLTSYELNEEGIPNTIIADNTGGILMQRGQVDMCIVGTDRTLFNGDVCNKIGTYLKALAAKDNNVPFYVALPSSTIDWSIKDSKDIPIEERDPRELSHIEGLEKDNNVPFYVALPSSTIDWNIEDHKEIPIEERDPEELSYIEGLDEDNKLKKVLIYPQKSKAMNLAFDVTPAKYITGLITEKGICEASKQGLKRLFK
jgi:methylthioribose-1-phosphate isomerase